ncbi:hypothetical protein [Ornithinimicrobium sediminis]|uniref:hypothetical protein n=1 Tax=Ornithinimicrobium sediminis TaxID=2904603 RepID=UPI001E3C9ADB|nr:hypothetical protein [Ornithinimicrobium sediminis]
MADVADNLYLRAVGRIEQAEALDPMVDRAAPLAGRLVALEPVRRFMDGDTTGVPAHTIATDVPFGAWFMAQFLDLYDDEPSRVAARRLVGLGIVSALPTGLTGWGRWNAKPRELRRVGVVHAAANAVATGIYVASWTAWTRGHQRAGVNLARLGSVALIAGGFLGGHLGRAAEGGTTPVASEAQAG